MKKILILLLLVGCNRDQSIPPNGSAKDVRIHLFAAGYCEPCKEELPLIKDWYLSKSNEARKHITITVYLTAGETAGVQATKEYANSFGKGLGLPFTVTPDKYSKLYRSFYGVSGPVPATVITDINYLVLRLFPPGKVSTNELENAISTR